MKKRIISLLLCLCMVFSLLPTVVLAADGEDPETSVGSEQVTQPDSEKSGDTEGQDKPTGSTESSGKEDSEEKEGSEESGDQSNPGNLEAPIEPVNESEIVATVNGTGYATLADAIKAANGKTLKLEKNVIEAITIPAGKTITLDLNGKRLVNSAEAQNNTIDDSYRKHTITNNGTLTIVDSLGGGIVDNVSHGRAALYNMGTITKIEGGKFTRSVDNSTDAASANGNSWYVVYNDDSAVIEVISGGEFLAIGNFSSLFCNCGLIGEISGGSFKQDGFIAFKNEGTVTKISGGTFSSMNESCIQNWGSIGEITGDTITAGSIGIWNFSSDTYKSVGKVGEISGGNISGSAAAIRLTDYDFAYLNKPSTTNKASITVSGGNISGNLQINSYTEFSVSGGNFSQRVAKEYLDSNLNAELKRASGETPYSYYASVDDATAAAQPGDSVTDLSAAVGGETVQVTLDYCGEETNTTITVKKGSSLSLPEPTREGYMFLGWFTDAESGDKVTNETSFQESVTIYARWGGEYSKWVWIVLPGTTVKKNTPKLNTADHFAYVQGYPDGTVKPTGNITRAETAAILFRLMDDTSRNNYYSTKSGFRDVASGSWYNTYVATLNNAGVITDSSNGYFRPNEAITRAELAAMLAQFADTKSAPNYFTDVTANYWAANAIAVCAKLGWINGYPDGSFRPDATITRAEMMAMINRALDRTPKSVSDLLSGMKTWSDNANVNAWYYLDVQEATNSHTYTKSGTHETWKKLR